MEPKAVTEWCHAAGIDPAKSTAVLLPVTEFSSEQIYRMMDRVTMQGRCLVRELKREEGTEHLQVLLEWDCSAISLGLPETIELGNERDIATFVLPVKVSKEPITNTTVSQEEPVTPQISMMGPELLTALGDFVEKCNQGRSVYAGSRYRKLRIFSGKKPVPSGEEDFEEWMEQAMQALDECDVPETQKKERITESLRGAALGAVRNLKLSKHDCTARDYLGVLMDVFGRTEKISDLMYQFEHTYQTKKEKLSEYMERLDKILHQLLLKKGIDPEMIDKFRVQQILRGAQPLNPIMLQLRTQKDHEKMKYPDLVRMVREEEAMLEVKEKGLEPKPTVEVGVVSTADVNSELAMLKSQVSQMMEMMASLATRITNPSEVSAARTVQREASEVVPVRKPKGSIICYNCGGVGHVRNICPSRPNEKKYLQRSQENSNGSQ